MIQQIAAENKTITSVAEQKLQDSPQKRTPVVARTPNNDAQKISKCSLIQRLN